MANKKASIQDIKKNKRNQLRNRHFKSLMKTLIKKAEDAIENKEKDSKTITKIALKQIAKNAAKGIIHKNSAAKKQSKLTKKLNA